MSPKVKEKVIEQLNKPNKHSSVTRLQYVKAVIGFFNSLENCNLIDKFHVINL
jgi:hypothetical protein